MLYMEIATLKKLAGITDSEPSGSEYNMTHTAQAIKDREKALGLRPGDPGWFKLWFRRPLMQKTSGIRGRKR